MYEKYIKRPMDIILTLLALLVLWPVLLVVAMLVRIKLGSPVIFKQQRPGKKDKDGNEKIFTMYKFRTMTDMKDKNGKLLSDSVRLTPFGSKLRSMSLDELPELFNILKGDLSIIGPRPQLVRDMVFMSDNQRQRHKMRPGLSGLAQISGRNAIYWEDKLEYDLKYIEKITFLGDWKIIIKTIVNVFKRENVTTEGMATSEDFGEYLLRTGKVERADYDKKHKLARELITK